MSHKPLHIERPNLKSATPLSPLAMNKFAILKAHTVITFETSGADSSGSATTIQRD